MESRITPIDEYMRHVTMMASAYKNACGETKDPLKQKYYEGIIQGLTHAVEAYTLIIKLGTELEEKYNQWIDGKPESPPLQEN